MSEGETGSERTRLGPLPWLGLTLFGGLAAYVLWRNLPMMVLIVVLAFGCRPSYRDDFVDDTTYVPEVGGGEVDTAPVSGIKAPVEDFEAPVEDFEAPIVDDVPSG
ncbi:hypothetical protein [Nocardiopsis lambiniae]|uniref:Uncharacterized protein n=1 Tax=Nocardiopsis lambiniae TaxID=3075539 RepID=A0ABU2M4A0_9ACTN|nr:hypothetical protein [Nocardiopsis sp. DSM 44743]MDT0327481.1 hypothetical protein [Nocardiopsis sp. DSM 44743]